MHPFTDATMIPERTATPITPTLAERALGFVSLQERQRGGPYSGFTMRIKHYRQVHERRCGAIGRNPPCFGRLTPLPHFVDKIGGGGIDDAPRQPPWHCSCIGLFQTARVSSACSPAGDDRPRMAAFAVWRSIS